MTKAKKSIGMVVDYTDKASKNLTRVRTGTIDRIEKTGTEIINLKTGELAGKAFRFRIQPLNPAKKAFWTATVPDRDGSIQKEWAALRPIHPAKAVPGFGVRGA